MSQLISVISQKGGAGKSTTTILLANIFFFFFRLKVAIIDADFPQNSVAKKRKQELAITNRNPNVQALYDTIYQDREPYPIIPTNIPSVPSMLEKLGDEFDFIFLDVTGSINVDGYKELLFYVNHFLIPSFEDEFSVWSAIELYQIIQKQIRPNSEAFADCHLFFNKIPRMNVIPHLLKQLTPNYNFLEAHLYEYKLYERRYRSTLFPIPKAKMEGAKAFNFAKHYHDTISPQVISH